MEAVIFDLGNVLLTLDFDRALNRLAAGCRKSRAELDRYIATTPWVNQLATGELSKWDFFETVVADLGYTGTFEEFAEAWSDMFAPNEPILAVARALKGRLARVILSNTNAIHMEYIFARYPCIHGFDGYVLSHEVGVQKPDRRIYDWALQRYRLNPRQAVFIDDLAENVAGARAVGLHAIHHQTADQTRQELTKLGVSSI